MSYRFCTLGKYQKRLNYKDRINPISQKLGNKIIIEKNKLELFRNRLSIHDTKTLFERLDIKSKLYLISVLVSLTGEQQTTTEPLDKQPAYKLSPCPDYDKSILRHLLDKNVLLIGCDTDPDVIYLYGNNQLSVDIGKCKFELSSPAIYLEVVVFICELYNGDFLNSIAKSKGFAELCKEIQINECMAFFNKSLSDHQLPSFRSEDEILLVLKNCLENFSVAQVYNTIWNGIRDAADYYRMSLLGRHQAVSFSIKCISRNMEKYLAYRWGVTPFQRDENIPQSKLSYIVFNTILSTDDGGFTQPLHELIQLDDQAPG